MELIFLKDGNIVYKKSCDLEYLQTLDLIDSVAIADKNKIFYIESKTLNIVTNRIYVLLTDVNKNEKNTTVNNITINKNSEMLYDLLKDMDITVAAHP